MLIEVTRAIAFDVPTERERINTAYKRKRDRDALHAIVDAVEQWDLNRFIEQVEKLDRTQVEYLCLPLADLLAEITNRARAAERASVAINHYATLPGSERLVQTAVAMSAYPRFAQASESDVANKVKADSKNVHNPN